MKAYHDPVLIDDILDLANIGQARLVVDATLGDGGYALACLQHMPESGRVIGIDLDPQALSRSCDRLRVYEDRIRFVQGNYRSLDSFLDPTERGTIDAVIADLGISMLQVSDPEKGFMFSEDGPLSMQMSGTGKTAEEVVNESDLESLARIIREYGEERHAKRIARAIVDARSKRHIRTTSQLARIVKEVVKGPYTTKSLARVFQAIRIEVNDELTGIQEFLPHALDALRPGGRMAVVAYHSLEDRLVKRFIAAEARPCTCPPDLPVCVCHRKPRLKAVGKLVRPAEEEVSRNPQARSAKLRVAEKI